MSMISGCLFFAIVDLILNTLKLQLVVRMFIIGLISHHLNFQNCGC